MPRKSSRGENLPKRSYTLIPPQLRERAAVLVLDEGCTISDVADIMNVNRSALSKVVQKARKERAQEPTLAAAGAAGATDGSTDGSGTGSGGTSSGGGKAAVAAALDPSKLGRGKAAISRHKAATSVSYEGMLSFPGPSSATFFKYLNRTKKSMDICVESITCLEIAKAVLAAHARGVRVRIITDDDQAKGRGSDIQKFIDAGIPVRDDNKRTYMHNKFCILDNTFLLNGSFNWSRQAVVGNNENLVINRGGQIVVRFREQFEKLWAQYER